MRLIDADAAIKDARQNYGDVHDAVLMEHFLNSQPTIPSPPNDPLTLEELREMDGEPVFIVSKRYRNGWCIVQWHGVSQSWMYFSRTGTAEGMTATPITAREYGDDWIAYRRKPKEDAENEKV